VRSMGAALGTILILAMPAAAAPNEELKQEVTIALEVLSDVQDEANAQFVLGLLLDPVASDAQWQAFFASYFKTRPFTRPLGEFWDYAVAESGEAEDRTIVLSGLCAAEALSAGLSAARQTNEPAAYASVSEATNWLQYAATGLAPQGKALVFQAVAQGLEKLNIDAGRVLGLGPGADPELTRLGMQVCLTLGEYVAGQARERAALSALLNLPRSTRKFWDDYGMFLFDNGALAPVQLASLDSLVSAVPLELHAIAALIVPEAVGLAGASSGLTTAGQLVFLSAASMDELTKAYEFTPQVGQPVAPQFTINAAQELVRAVQAVQFAQRPDLVHRRDVIIGHAKEHKERYLRRHIPPSVYQERPDQLLPLTAFLWFIDSSTAFEMAVDLYEWRQEEPMDALLLLADVLSGGTDSTLLFQTSPDGQVEAVRSRVGRTHLDEISLLLDEGPRGAASSPVPADLDYLTSIDIDGATWTFDLNSVGLSTRFHKITR